MGVVSGDEAMGESAGLDGKKSKRRFGREGLAATGVATATGGGGGSGWWVAMLLSEGSGWRGAVDEVVDIKERGGEGVVTRTDLKTRSGRKEKSYFTCF